MADIKKELSLGVFYTAIAKYSGIIISLIITAILARLLSPDDFGIVAIATVIISFFNIFTDMGISPAIIQDKSLTIKDLSNIFSFTVWMGLLISFIFFCCSWFIATFYNHEVLVIICQMLSVNLFFASITIVPNALLYKNKEFKFIAKRSLIIQGSSGLIAIVVALSGGGLYALVISPILSSILYFIISITRYPQKLLFTLGLKTIKKIFSYSAYQFMFNIINYFSRNLDKLLIGKYMGMEPLGYYEKSYRLMMLPLQNITQVITPVMHPIFSDYQDDLNRLSSSYERIIRLLAFLGLPLSVFLFFTSKEIIIFFFGEQWLISIPIFQILSLSVGIQVILSSSGSIFQAAGDTRSLFICGLFSSILNVSGIALGVFYFSSLKAVAWCICCTFTINFIQCYIQMYLVTFKRSFLFFIRQLISPLIISLIIAAVLGVTYYYLDDRNIFITFFVKSIFFIIIFGCYIQVTKEYDIWSKIKKVFSGMTNIKNRK